MIVSKSRYVRIVSKLRGSFEKLVVAALVCIAFILMLLGKPEIALFDKAKAVISDISAPVIQVLSYPVQGISYLIDTFNDLKNLRQENVKLRQENATLKEWQNYAHKLEKDIEGLSGLVNFITPPDARIISAKVVADSGSNFSQSVIAFAGAREGVKKGQVVVTDQGLVGRVLNAGEFTSRILLLTDSNSRVPVFVGPKKLRAMLVGNNTENPEIMFLPIDAKVSPGDKIITSGIGGVFPPDIEVGEIAYSSAEEGMKAFLSVDRDFLGFVKIVDYAMEGILKDAQAGCK